MNKRSALSVLAYRFSLITLLAVLPAACSFHTNKGEIDSLPATFNRFEPEPAVALTIGEDVQKSMFAENFAAVTANPYATQAAANILAQGGSAIDAAIAAQMVLGLVEPQSSGLGGGGFMVYWHQSSGELFTFDGRETAPLAATEALFLDENQQPLNLFNAVVGGRSVGVPGLVRMLARAHEDFGLAPWETLFEDARQLADVGFTVSPRLHELLTRVPAVKVRDEISSYFFPDNTPLKPGETLRNSRYEAVLSGIATDGPEFFYRDLAASIVDDVNQDANPGKLTRSDFESYQAVPRDPICVLLFEHKLCGMAPPSSGPATVFAILGMMDALISAEDRSTNDGALSSSPLFTHYFIEASKLAFADRNTYLADPDFVAMPLRSLLDKTYFQQRAALILRDSVMTKANPGQPDGIDVAARILAPSAELASTTHLSIVDSYGNVVSMTTSIEAAFGSRVMSEGFLLNNQLTDFSFMPLTENNSRVANRVQPGKRPLSSMSPIIVFDASDRPVMAIGSPGGKSIIPYVARVLFETLALDRSLQESVDDSQIVHTGRGLVLEKGFNPETLEELRAIGHEPKLKAQASGLHVLSRANNSQNNIPPGLWEAVADSRREGTVAGQ